MQISCATSCTTDEGVACYLEQAKRKKKVLNMRQPRIETVVVEEGLDLDFGVHAGECLETLLHAARGRPMTVLSLGLLSAQISQWVRCAAELDAIPVILSHLKPVHVLNREPTVVGMDDDEIPGGDVRC